jgi:hypothetical protein
MSLKFRKPKNKPKKPFNGEGYVMILNNAHAPEPVLTFWKKAWCEGSIENVLTVIGAVRYFEPCEECGLNSWQFIIDAGNKLALSLLKERGFSGDMMLLCNDCRKQLFREDDEAFVWEDDVGVNYMKESMRIHWPGMDIIY